MALEVDIEKRAGSFHLEASFSAEGGILGILGASGSGKSMTLRCIAGIEKPDRGRIVLDGRVLFDSGSGICLPPQRRRVGCLFQNCALFPEMTVRQNILCGLHGEKDRGKREARADEMMDLLQIRPLADLRPRSLSGGQTQLAALGRILVNEPDVLLMDEPFSSLDAHLRQRMQVKLTELLADYGRSVILVTHDRDEAFRMCGRLGVMERGRMQAVKASRELFANPETRAAAVITGCKNIAAARKTGEREVFVPEWNIHLETGSPVDEGLRAVGIRAHHFRPDTACNRFPVRILRETQEPFERISEFRFEGQDPESPAVWRKYAGETPPETVPDALGVLPEHVLLLYE